MSVTSLRAPELAQLLHQLEARFGPDSTVTGWDVGYHWKDGRPTDRIGLRLHVRAKRHPSLLGRAERFPKRFNGYRLDVIEGAYAPPEAITPPGARPHFPVLAGGISCGRRGAVPGSLGALVIDRRTGRPALLSSWHVLAGRGAQTGQPILQPGGQDPRPAARDRIARLGRHLLDRDGDAAMAPLTGARPWVPALSGVTQVPPRLGPARLGAALSKPGSNRARAMVDGIGTYRLRYQGQLIAIDGFKLVPDRRDSLTRSTAPLSRAGDSGSLWCRADGTEAIGLEFASNPDRAGSEQFALAGHLTRIAERLEFRLANLADMMAADQSMTPPRANHPLPHPTQPHRPAPMRPPNPELVPETLMPPPGPSSLPGSAHTPAGRPHTPQQASEQSPLGPVLLSQRAFPPTGASDQIPVSGQTPRADPMPCFEPIRDTAGDADDLLPLEPEPRPAPVPVSQMLDRLLEQPLRLSRSHDLEPQLRLALAAAGVTEAAYFALSTAPSRHFPTRPGAELAGLFNCWPGFRRYFRLHPSSFDHARTYHQILAGLEAEFARVGIIVTP